jgi:hypothetical protein
MECGGIHNAAWSSRDPSNLAGGCVQVATQSLIIEILFVQTIIAQSHLKNVGFQDMNNVRWSKD